MAKSRNPMDRLAFLSAFQRVGISHETGEFLLEQMRPYYFDPLTPRPEDRVETTMRIDPDDIADLAILYCERFSVPLPDRTVPQTLPRNPSWEELGLWLEDHRAGVVGLRQEAKAL